MIEGWPWQTLGPSSLGYGVTKFTTPDLNAFREPLSPSNTTIINGGLQQDKDLSTRILRLHVQHARCPSLFGDDEIESK